MGRPAVYCHPMDLPQRFPFVDYEPELVQGACCERCGSDVETTHPHSVIVRCCDCNATMTILDAIKAEQAKAVSA